MTQKIIPSSSSLKTILSPRFYNNPKTDNALSNVKTESIENDSLKKFKEKRKKKRSYFSIEIPKLANLAVLKSPAFNNAFNKIISNIKPEDEIMKLEIKTQTDIKPSLIMEFIFLCDEKPETKLKILFIKLILPHMLAILLSLAVIFLQNQVNNLCWVKDVCDCKNDLWIKLYSIVRSIFTYWNLITLMIFYSFFTIQEIRNNIFLRIILLGLFYMAIIVIYMSTDGQNDILASITTFGSALILVFFIFVVIFYKLDFNFKLFCSKIMLQTLFLITLFSYLLTKRYFFIFIADINSNYRYGQNKTNLGQLLISLICFFYKLILKGLILNFGVKTLRNGDGFNPIIFFMRIAICFIVCINTSTIYTMELPDWGGWVSIIFYIMFLLEFYTRYNISEKIYNYLAVKLFNKTFETEENEETDILKRVLSGYLMDFQLICIPRMIILYYYQHLIDSHPGDFSKDCNLRLSGRFPINIYQLYVIIGFNLGLPIIFFCWMVKKKQLLFELRLENYNILQKAYVIFLFHVFFEFVFQDFITG